MFSVSDGHLCFSASFKNQLRLQLMQSQFKAGGVFMRIHKAFDAGMERIQLLIRSFSYLMDAGQIRAQVAVFENWLQQMLSGRAWGNMFAANEVGWIDN